MHLGISFFASSGNADPADGTARRVFRREAPFSAAVRRLLFAIVALGCCAQARASLINAQFAPVGIWSAGGPFSGAAAIGADGDYWNAITGNALGTPQLTLLDSAQAVTPVTAQTFVSGYAYEAGDSQTFGGTPYAQLMSQYAFDSSSAPRGTVILSHLDPGLYDLYLYSAGPPPFAPLRMTRFLANDVQGTVGPNTGENTLVQGVNYLHLQPTVTDTGLLSIDFFGTVADFTGVEGDFNGFQLVPAPEPGTAALFMLLAAIALLFWRHPLGIRAFKPKRTAPAVFQREVSHVPAGATGGLLFASVALGCCAQTRASLINVQFDSEFGALDGHKPYSGAAAIGSDGDYWNQVVQTIATSGDESGYLPAALDNKLQPTPVSVQIFPTSFWSESTTQDQTFAGTPYADLMGQYAYNNSRLPRGLTVISNLDPGIYDLYLYSAGTPDGQTRVTRFTANDVQGFVGPNASATTLISGVNYLHLEPTVTDNGLLSIHFQGMVSDFTGVEGDFNAFQLVPAPEPGTAALLVLSGAIALLIWRSRPGLRMLKAGQWTTLFTLVVAAPAVADDTWTGSSNHSWDNAANWTSGIPQSTDDVIFPSGLGGQINFGSSDTANSLTFSDNYALFGSSLTLSGGNVTVASGNTVTLGGGIVAPNGLTTALSNRLNPAVFGGGTLVLNPFNANGYVGNPSLLLAAEDGTVQLAADFGNAVGGITDIGPQGSVQITGINPNVIYEGNPGDNTGPVGLVNTGNGFFDLNGHAIAFDRLTGAGVIGNTSTKSAQITLGGNNGSSRFSGQFAPGNPLTLQKVGTGTFILAGAANNSGLSLVVNQGTVVLSQTGGPAGYAVGLGGITINGATVQLGNGRQIPAGAPIRLNGGTFDLRGYTTSNGGLEGVGLITNNGSPSGGFGQNILDLENTTSHIFSGVISDGTHGPLTLETGFLPGISQILNGHNTFTGPTIIASEGYMDIGTLEIGPDGSLGGGRVDAQGAINEPSLRLDNPDALPFSTVLTVDNWFPQNMTLPLIAVDLNFTGSDVISGLSIGSVSQPPGIYNAQTNPGLFTGTGNIIVAPEPGSGVLLSLAALGLLGRRRKRGPAHKARSSSAGQPPGCIGR